VKLAQDDLKIVDSLEIPSKDPKFLEKLAEERNWGLSVLFVDE
jgi:large subunit ribosomal protein L4